MALGPVSAEVDSDLSHDFDADASERPFTVTMVVEVHSRYAEQAEKLARKAIGKNQGKIVSAEPV
jgi:hypothetical protein